MKTATLTTLLCLSLGAAVAQYSALPSCARGCAASALGNLNCGLSAACICGNSDFINGITCCVACACDASDQSAVLSFAKGICSANSITTLPSTIACTTSYSCSKPLTLASNAATATGPTGVSATDSVSTSPSSAGLPRQAAANVGMGVVGGLAAAAALL